MEMLKTTEISKTYQQFLIGWGSFVVDQSKMAQIVNIFTKANTSTL